MTQAQLLIEREDGYAILTLNRPESRNALSPQLLVDLCAAFRSLQGESDIHAVILIGSGSAFCAGLALKGDAPRRHRFSLLCRLAHGPHDPELRR